MCFVDIDKKAVDMPEDLPSFPYQSDLQTELNQLLNRYHAIFISEKQACSQSPTPKHKSGSGLGQDSFGTGSWPNSPKRMEILQQSETWKKISNLAKKTGGLWQVLVQVIIFFSPASLIQSHLKVCLSNFLLSERNLKYTKSANFIIIKHERFL